MTTQQPCLGAYLCLPASSFFIIVLSPLIQPPVMLRLILLFAYWVVSTHSLSAQAEPKIRLIDFATGFTAPVDIAHCGDSRLFVVEQGGKIWIVDSTGTTSAKPFLDITDRVNFNGERGLLGLAFHPRYAENGYFYLNYTKKSGNARDSRIARFSRSTADPASADPTSETTLLEVYQPYANHNGGCLKFGPDSLLYIGFGDGGSGGDPQGNGQKTDTHLGKMLRIDVNSNSQGNYGIPPDNPFLNTSGYLPEIWSLGLRNPWRFSFDRLSGELWIADVGQNKREEVNFEPRNTPGRNYGWRCYEGTSTYNTTGCQPASAYIAPVFEYANPALGQSVTGGFRYRGSQYPGLAALYLLADYVSGRWWAIRQNADSTFSGQELGKLAPYEVTSFGEDYQGELYTTAYASGKIQRVTDLCSTLQLSSSSSGPVCDDSEAGFINLEVAGGTPPYTQVWADGSTDKDRISLNPGSYSVEVRDANQCLLKAAFSIASLSPPAPILQAADTVLCAGESTILSTGLPAPSGYVYQWQANGDTIAGANASDLLVLGGGIYQVRLIGQDCNSRWSTAAQVDQEFAIAPIIMAASDTLSTGAGWAAYQWLLDGEAIPEATDYQWIAKKSGSYSVQVSSANGCLYTSLLSVQIDISSIWLPPSVRQFSLLPNPTRDQFALSLQLASPDRIRISLTDLGGKTIFQQSRQAAEVALPIEVQALEAGTYLLRVDLSEGYFTRQVVKL